MIATFKVTLARFITTSDLNRFTLLLAKNNSRGMRHREHLLTEHIVEAGIESDVKLVPGVGL